ncbi:MAG TPA: methylmalonyl-CoA mutase family protein [Bdellovibrionales bacterium]|nr:methylmalonyl-CoA mutase family protein [Bdellovibrionales bacterium]
MLKPEPRSSSSKNPDKAPKSEPKKFETSSGETIKEYYGPEDWSPTAENMQRLGRAGEYPFTRGVYPTMYRGRHWTMRQYAGFGSAKESNKRYQMLLAKGQTGLSIAFDLPTQMGYDSDHVMASGEVGKVGVAISSIEDMEILLDQIPLDKVSTSMTINSTAGILLAFYVAVARRRGISGEKLQGTVQNDLLKEYIARGTYIYPPKPSLRVITDIFDYCREHVPNWNTISISGYHIREAGATAAQELAFTLANAITYVEAAVEKGLPVDTFAPRLSFFFNVHNNFFEEIAKFRAARRMWARIMKEQFGAKNPNSLKLRFHSQTAGVTLTAQQPENNIVRVSMQALAAVLGGTQSLHTNSMDEALGLPTEKSATIALRTQQIIAHESGVSDSVDPLAGSFFIESLTDKVEEAALKYLSQIQERGGMIKCIETGWVQREIQNSAYKDQIDLDSKRKIVVGVNEFQADDSPVETLKIDPKIERDQVRRLTAFKKARDTRKVKSHLEKITNAAESSENLVPLFVEAVDAGVTLGEISDALRGVFGLYRESVTF